MINLKCQACDLPLAIADTRMVRRGIEITAPNPVGWKDRLDEPITPVCPRCDAYALGIETSLPVPFYSAALCAFATSQDFDLWNDDPAQWNTHPWPHFGRLAFSASALRSAVDYFAKWGSDLGEPARAQLSYEELLIASGTSPDEESVDWATQLRDLCERAHGAFTEFDLDNAVRGLVGMLWLATARFPTKFNLSLRTSRPMSASRSTLENPLSAPPLADRMDEIKEVIRTLSRHEFRSMSNVAGEFVERLIAEGIGASQAGHCQKGFDLLCENLGKVEVKSRNADAKSLQCTLPEHKMAELDNFILAIVRTGELERVLLFDKKTLMSLRSSSGNIYVNRQHFDRAQDITGWFVAQN